MNTNIFNYQGSPITFQKGDSLMINATEMAKPFGKLTKDWLINKQAKEFMHSLSAVRGIPLTELVQVVQGGAPEQQGTWMHEDVALEFARWLSPAFAIWCNDRVKELLRDGVVTINDEDDTIAHAMRILNERLERKQQALYEAKKQIEVNAPKVAFADAIIASKSSCLIGELAKLISQNGVHIGQNRLFEWLREEGYIGKRGEMHNIPLQKYIEQGLFELKKGVRSGSDGVMHTTITPKVTGKGQAYFINKFLSSSAQSA